MKFTGERVIEGNTPERIWLDHVARYRFAAAFVKGKTVLDVACGTGYGSAILSQDGKASHVIGIDISREAIEYAIRHHVNLDVEFKAGDAHNIQLPDDALDVVVSFETIEHLNDYQKYLTQIYRVLNENGLLIVSSPNRRVTSPGKSLRDKPNNEFHTVEFTRPELKALLARFKFKDVKFFGQRPIHKLLLLSPVRKVLGKIKNDYYLIADGNPEVRYIPLLFEPRYYVAICWKEA